MDSISNIFKSIDKPTDRKLRYEGYCLNCKNITSHRYGGHYSKGHFFICMKCGYKNLGKHE